MYGGDVSNDNMLSGMSVTFSTKSKPSASSISYGASTSDLATSIPTRSTTQYHPDGTYHHEAVIPSLDCAAYPAGSPVFYQAHADSDSSAPLSFASPGCSRDAADKPLNLAIFGDWGYMDSDRRPMKIPATGDEFKGLFKEWSAQHTMDRLQTWKQEKAMDAMWILGDVGYIDDSYAHAPLSFTYEKDFDGFMNWIQNLTSAIPTAVSPGNHESECHSPSCVTQYLKHGRHLSNFTAFNTRFNMPSAQSGGSREGTNMWYSFNMGPAHIVSMNTETDFSGAEEETTGDAGIPYLKAGGFGVGTEYLDWLDADLAAATADPATKWIVVGGHRPFASAHIEETFKPIFDKYRVHMYFAGHAHSYKRSAPVAGETVHVVAGGAGCDEMGPPQEELFAQCTLDWSVESDKYSVGLLSISDEKLSWKLVNSEDGSVIDQLDVTE